MSQRATRSRDYMPASKPSPMRRGVPQEHRNGCLLSFEPLGSQIAQHREPPDMIAAHRQGWDQTGCSIS